MTRHVTQLLDLHGNTALVTGDSRGLGFQHALNEAGLHGDATACQDQGASHEYR